MARPKKEKPLEAIVHDVLALGQLKEDRSIAVMAGAVADYWLGRAIFARLVEMTPDEKNTLLDNNGHGAIASFSAKIWMGFALGLYRVEARRDLLKIKEIRNKFAHTDGHIDFDDSEIVELCKKLLAPRYLAKSSMKPEPTDPKARFLDAIHHLVAGFHLCTKFHIKRPSPPDTFQY